MRKVGLGFVHETAQIDLVLQTLVLSDGTTVPIPIELTQVENARESINKQGRIQGIRSTATLSQRASGTVGMLALRRSHCRSLHRRGIQRRTSIL